jgi:aminoglycoside phosphotransferase (APT) family kinase protein
VFPELIDSGVDDDGPWVVTPFHHGEQIGWSTEPPAAVYAALARLHLRHLGRADELSPQIPRVDDDFVRYALTEFAPSRLARAAEQAAHPVHARAFELLERFAEDDRLSAGLAALPATLLHGDVYGDNVIVGPDTPQLIDWGSARVGPAMLDVMMAGGPAGIASYEQTWALLSGEPLDEWELATGQAWAVAVSNAMFVGVIAERSGDFAAEVLDKAETAIEQLGRQLSLR